MLNVVPSVVSTGSDTVPSTSSGTESPVVEPVETTGDVETTISNCSLHLFLIIVRIINPFHKQFSVVDLVGEGSG